MTSPRRKNVRDLSDDVSENSSSVHHATFDIITIFVEENLALIFQEKLATDFEARQLLAISDGVQIACKHFTESDKLDIDFIVSLRDCVQKVAWNR